MIRSVFTKGDVGFRSGDILVMDKYGFLYFRVRIFRHVSNQMSFILRGHPDIMSYLMGVILTDNEN